MFFQKSARDFLSMAVFFSHFGSVFFKNLVVFFRIFSGSVYPLSILNLSGALVYIVDILLSTNNVTIEDLSY